MKTIKIDKMGRSYLYKNGKKIAHHFCAKGHDKRATGKRSDGTCLACNRKTLHKNYIDWKTKKPEEYIDKGRHSNWNRKGILNADGRVFTMIDRDRAYQIQQGRCAICGTHESDLKFILRADHDHSTNIFRGLLCNNCNSAIGLFYEDKERILKALEYLK